MRKFTFLTLALACVLLLAALPLYAGPVTPKWAATIGLFTPRTAASADTVPQVTLTRLIPVDKYYTDTIGVGLAGSVGGDNKYTNGNVSIGRLVTLGNPARAVTLRLGVSVGVYFVQFNGKTTTDVGWSPQATATWGNTFASAAWTDVRNSSAGDGWAVSLGRLF